MSQYLISTIAASPQIELIASSEVTELHGSAGSKPSPSARVPAAYPLS
jgi:heterodisulfide reductase subunit A-like polyferredoxin